MVQVLGSQIATRVKRQFGDESGVQITDADIMIWINDALREAATQNPSINLKTTYLDATVGQQIIAIPNALDVASVHSVAWSSTPTSQSYADLIYMSPQQFAATFPSVNASLNPSALPHTGYPTHYTADSSAAIKVYPIPALTISQSFLLTFSAFFPEVTNLATPMSVSAKYYQYMLEYCLMKSYELDENWEAADRKASFIQSTLNTLHSADLDVNQTKYPVIGE